MLTIDYDSAACLLLKLEDFLNPVAKLTSPIILHTSAWRPLRVTHLFAYNTFILNLQLRWCSWLLSGWAPPRPESVAYMPCYSCAAGRGAVILLLHSHLLKMLVERYCESLCGVKNRQ